MTPVPPTSHAHGKQKHARARKLVVAQENELTPVPESVANAHEQPVVAANVFHIEAVKGRMLAKRAGMEEAGIDVGPVPPPSGRRKEA